MRFILALCIVFLTVFDVPSPAWAEDQPPPSASAEIHERKVREEAEKELLEKKPPQPVEIEEETSEAAEPGVEFFVRSIRLRPSPVMPTTVALNLLIPSDELKPVIAPYLNRSLTFKDLKELCKKLREAYHSRGLFALIGVPPQGIQGDEVTLEVLVSIMGDLHIEGNHYFRASKIKSYWRISKGEILRYDKIVQGIQDMNEHPDRLVKSGLKAGLKPGTTDVILKVEEHLPVHAKYSFDNQGAKLTGHERTGFMLRHNNLLSVDDTFLIGTNFGETYGALFLQHKIPLNARGTDFIYGFSHSQVNPKKEFKPLGVNGISQTYNFSLRQKLHSGRRVTAGAHVGFDFKEKRTRTRSVTTVWDRLRILSTGGEMQFRDKTGIWTAEQEVAFSFSPHGDGYLLTSRQAESHFFKTTLSLERNQRLPFGTSGVVRVQGQLSPGKLPPQEEILLGGATSVRGYPESDYLGDQGVLTNVEYHTPFFLLPKQLEFPRGQPVRNQIQLIAFWDHGYGRLRQPSETEHRTRNLMSVGGGFAIQVLKYAGLRFEWGVPLADDPLTESGKSQFHFHVQAEI